MNYEDDNDKPLFQSETVRFIVLVGKWIIVVGGTIGIMLVVKILAS